MKPTSELKVKLTKNTRYSTISKGNLKVLIKKAKTKNVITILNVYAPYTQKVKNDSKELLYDINTTITSIKNNNDIILQRESWKKLQNSDSNQDLCLGRHAKGR